MPVFSDDKTVERGRTHLPCLLKKCGTRGHMSRRKWQS